MDDSDGDLSFHSGRSDKLDDSVEGAEKAIQQSTVIKNPTQVIPSEENHERESQEFPIECNNEDKKEKNQNKSEKDENKNKDNKNQNGEENKTVENKKEVNNKIENNEDNKEKEINDKNSNNELKNKSDNNSSTIKSKEEIKRYLDETKKNLEVIFSQKIKDILNIEVDKEKTQQKKHTVYQISILKKDKYSNNSSSFAEEKKILSYRRYNDFYMFYSKLKIRYPQYIFPRLSDKNIMTKIIDNPEFLENRRKELQYLINKLYTHNKIGKSEEFKKFINDSVFDIEYYNNLPNKYVYEECEKAENEKGYISQGYKKVSTFLSGFYSKSNTELKESEREKNILSKIDEYKNKIVHYKNLLEEIKTFYESSQEEIKQYAILSKDILYLKDEKANQNKEEDYNKVKFNELEGINKKYSEILKDNSKFLLEMIIDPLNFCILDVEGINKAFERYVAFIEKIKLIQNIDNGGNKIILEEKTKAAKDKEEYEIGLENDLYNYEKCNSKVYQEIISRLILYLKNINENNVISFLDSNLGTK